MSLARSQVLLSSILLAVPPDVLRQVPGIKFLVESILPYSERHFARLERLHKASFLLDYTVSRHWHCVCACLCVRVCVAFACSLQFSFVDFPGLIHRTGRLTGTVAHLPLLCHTRARTHTAASDENSRPKRRWPAIRRRDGQCWRLPGSCASERLSRVDPTKGTRKRGRTRRRRLHTRYETLGNLETCPVCCLEHLTLRCSLRGRSW